MIINVLPWREKKHNAIKKLFLKHSLISILIGLVIVFCIHFFLIKYLQTQEVNNDVLTSKINIYNQVIQNAASATALIQTIHQKNDIIVSLKNEQSKTISLFNLFQTILPKNVYLTQVSRSNNLITLIGNASKNKDISEIMQHLESLPDFKNVHLKKITAKKFEINFMEAS